MVAVILQVLRAEAVIPAILRVIRLAGRLEEGIVAVVGIRGGGKAGRYSPQKCVCALTRKKRFIFVGQSQKSVMLGRPNSKTQVETLPLFQICCLVHWSNQYSINNPCRNIPYFCKIINKDKIIYIANISFKMIYVKGGTFAIGVRGDTY